MTTLSTKWAYAITAAGGGVGWVLVSHVSGRREAWDSALYFSWFLPSLSLMVVAIGFLVPVRSWRWGLVPFAAQAVVAFAQNPTANLMPLGLIVFAFLGGVIAVPAWLGATLRRSLDRQHSDP